jgi:filamentous hemagglutinin family protein
MSNLVANTRSTIVLMALASICGVSLAGAQIVVGHSFGAGGPLTPANGNFTINSGLGRTVGSNLFQSFEQFNIDTGQTATFSGPGSISNIIAGVTGPSASNINGTLSSTIAGANVYLINPNGVVFGPNARLNVTGSFAASTADKVQLKGKGVFNVRQPAASKLTSAPPAAFGFLGQAPKAIAVKGSQLSVPAGKAVSLVGGGLRVTQGANVSAPAGRINAVSVASAGEVAINPALPAGPVNTGTIADFGNMEISDANLDTSDGGTAVDAAGRGGGSIYVRAGRLTMDQGQILSKVEGAANGRGIDVDVTGAMSLTNLSVIDAGTAAAGRGGNVLINAGTLSAAGFSADGKADTRIVSQSAGAGAAGNLTVNAGNLTLSEDAFMDTGPEGSGPGGTLTVQVKNSVQLLTGGGITIDARPGSTGISRDLSVTARSIALSGVAPLDSEPSFISASNFGPGTGGTVRISAARLSDNGSIVADANAQGGGGDIMIKGNALTVGLAGYIETDTYSQGSGGDLRIAVAGTATIKGFVSADVGEYDDGSDPSATQTDLQSTGHGGRLSLVAGGSISVLASGLVAADTYGRGAGGSVRITAPHIIVSGYQPDPSDPSSPYVSAISADTYSTGTGGDVQVMAGDSLKALAGAGISADSYGSGRGGSVLVRSPQVVVSGYAPNVDDPNDPSTSYLSAEAYGPGRAGSLTIVGDNLSVANYALVSADACGRGNAGNLTISMSGSADLSGGGTVEAQSFLEDPGAGKAGSVTVSAANVVITGAQFGISSGILDDTGYSGRGYGDLSVTTGSLTIENRGEISASTCGPSAAGDIRLTVNDSLQVLSGGGILGDTVGSGKASDIDITAGHALVSGSPSIISSSSAGTGAAGHVEVSAEQLLVNEGGSISTNAGPQSSSAGLLELNAPAGSVELASGGSVTAKTVGDAPGGDILVNAGRLDIDGQNSKLSAVSTGDTGTPGAAGRLQVDVSGPIALTDGGLITTGATDATGGSIDLTAGGDLRLSRGASIDAQSVGGGGNVDLEIGGSLVATNSNISATTTGETASGGNVTIGDKTRFIILVDTAITAEAQQGTGGTISNGAAFSFATGSKALATAPAPEFDPNGLLNPFDASSASGNVGTVVSRSPNLSLAATLGQVTYRTPDLVVLNQYPANDKQLAEAKEAAAKYLDVAAGKPAAKLPAPPAPPPPLANLKPAERTPHAESATSAKRRTAANLPEVTRHAPPSAGAAPSAQIKPSGVIAVQVSKKTDNSADTIGVILIDPVSRQPASPDVYEIAKKRLESGDTVTIEGQSATLVSRNP